MFLGYATTFLTKSMSGDVGKVCDIFTTLAQGSIPLNYKANASIFDATVAHKKGIVIISGGEPTVEVHGTGVGGRNQELALRFAKFCTENSLKNVYLLSGGTDGYDGPTQAAGAIGCYFDQSEEDVPNAVRTIEEYLCASNSYRFYDEYSPSTHLITGHTGTNVMDLHILLIKLGEK